jgi:hypothetical protein
MLLHAAKAAVDEVKRADNEAISSTRRRGGLIS